MKAHGLGKLCIGVQNEDVITERAGGNIYLGLRKILRLIALADKISFYVFKCVSDRN